MKRFRLHIGVIALLTLLVPALSLPLRADTDEIPDFDPQVAVMFAKIWQAYQDKKYFEVPAMLDQALIRARQVHDRAGECLILFGQSEMYRKLGMTAQATQLEAEARKAIEGDGDKVLAATTLRSVAVGYRFMGQHANALSFFQQSLAASKEANDKAGSAATLLQLGKFYSGQGQKKEALESSQQSLELYQELKEPGGQAKALHMLGVLHQSSGQVQKALEFYQQALAASEQTDDLRQKALTLCAIGGAYANTAQASKALEFYEQGLSVHRNAIAAKPNTGNELALLQDQRREAATLLSLGGLYRHLGQKEKYVAFIQQARDLYSAVREQRGVATTSLRLAEAQLENGQVEEALQNAQEARAVFSELQNKPSEGTALAVIANIFRHTDRPREAFENYKQAVEIFEAAQIYPSVASVMARMASIDETQGRFEDALAHREKALRIWENMRASMGSLSEFKVSLLESYLPNYQSHINLLLQMKRTEEAFAWSEKTKARALLDLMESGKVNLTKGISAEDQQKETTLRQRASSLNEQLVAETAQLDVNETRLASLRKQLAQAENALQLFTDALYAKYPSLAQKRSAKTVTLAEVAQFLPVDTALLSYLTLANGKTVLFAVRNENGKAAVDAHTIAANRDELIELTDDFRAACANPQKTYKNKARDLYELLIAPAATQIKGKTRLLICPDGMLWGLPFQALLGKDEKGAERFLVEQQEIAYAYSASGVQAALSASQPEGRTKPGSTLLVMANPDFGGAARFAQSSTEQGNPTTRPITADSRAVSAESRAISAESRSISADSRAISADSRNLPTTRTGAITPLPGTQLEADALRTDFPDATVYTGEKALEATVKKLAGDYKYLHFATHGLFNDAAPMLSSVVLAQPLPNSGEDGFLTAREIFNLDLNADMVVLSACDTGRGQKRSGEGVIGLTWALFVAGAPTQVVSQWAVNDQSTATLMKSFYGQLKTGKARGEALREADIRMLRDGTHAHPFYWAPFVLMGDWRN